MTSKVAERRLNLNNHIMMLLSLCMIWNCFIVAGGFEGKYRVAAPELMQDTFMSDSEDEGGKCSSIQYIIP